ncbi:hypothetical protein AVEN_209045-1 [Araneus ventricosus]|uniref:Uncharacterized protein n=1 Tax=Araneus ventricosus TaxID=182803 RepID=A0A4Y2KL21_ARAVE|nr:hypothetical protein AVEN_209045-1 [Araneus ventricosus]
MMVSSVRDLCIEDFGLLNISSELREEIWDKRLNCTQNCKQGCLSQRKTIRHIWWGEKGLHRAAANSPSESWERKSRIQNADDIQRQTRKSACSAENSAHSGLDSPPSTELQPPVIQKASFDSKTRKGFKI